MDEYRGLAVAGLVVLSGCTVPIIGNAPSYPDRPERLDNTSVVNYVEQYERAERYRALFENQGGIEFSCRTGTPVELGDGHFVRTRCDVTEGPRGSGGPLPFAYFVNETQTLRVPTGPYTWPAPPTFPSSQGEADSTSTDGTVFVYNLAQSHRNLTLSMESRDASTPGPPFRNSTSLELRSGFGYHFDSIDPGNYELTADGDGQVTSTVWHVNDSSDPGQNVVSVVVTPGGDTRFVRLSHTLE